MIRKYKYIAILLLAFMEISCDNANDLLDQYIKNGPIVYAGKIKEMDIQSGYHRIRVNLYPEADVNRSHCILWWNVSSGVKDSVKVEYVEANYDEDLDCYYTIISVPSIEGNLLIESQNVDTFGNRSLINNKGAFIYGPKYTSTLVNSPVSFSANKTTAIFTNRIGAVDNLVSYEQTNGQFTQEVLVKGNLSLVNPKIGGLIRSKTRYVIKENDIDTLVTSTYLETVIP